MRRSSLLLPLLFAAACARTGLLDFGVGDDSNDAGAGGGGTGGTTPTGGTGPEQCRFDADCPVDDPCAPPRCILEGSSANAKMHCVATPVECDDGNPCTTDRCEPGTGECISELPRDADGDGFLGEPAPDAPPTCGGMDCDDTDAAVNPLALEICDGRDNDCDEAIDEGMEYTRVRTEPLPISPPERGRATHGGLVWSGESYGVTYNTTSDHKQSYFKLLTEFGGDASEETIVSQINADAYSGPIEWSGSNFFTAFSDARQAGNYEIYAARFRGDGVKVQSDVRLTDARDFSLNPVVVWTGDEYVVAWDDRRGRADGGVPQVFARRFSETGMRIGEEVLISPTGEWGEYPAIAVGKSRLGIVYVSLGSDAVPRVRFRSFDLSLGSAGTAVDLPGSAFASAPSVAFAGGRFLTAWAFAFGSAAPGPNINVAVVDEASGVPSEGSVATFGFTFVRGPSLVSLGDRVLLVFSGALSDGAYELWATPVIATPLTTRIDAARLTFTDAFSLFPYAVRGPDGTIGIVFDEDDETPPTSRRPYFMSVGCEPPTLPPLPHGR